MANPDLIAVAHVYKDSNELALTTASQDLIAAIATGHFAEVNSIFVSNIDGTNNATVTVSKISAGPTTTEIVKVVVVPAGATLVIVSKNAPLHLKEGQKVTALASANSRLKASASWTDMS